MANAIEAGRAFMRLFLDDNSFRRGLDNASKRLTSFGKSVTALGTKFTAIGAALAAPFAVAVRHFQTAGDALNKMAARTGLSVEALSELQFAAEQSGSDVGTLERGLVGMARGLNGLERGLSTAVESFEALGLSADQLLGQSPDEQFVAIAKALSEIEDPTRRAGLALQVFGRAGTQLLPLVGNIDALREQARELGLTIDTETAAAAADFTDAMNELRRVVLRTAVAVGAALGPALTNTVRWIRDIAKSSIEWAKTNGAIIRTAAAMAASITGIGLALILVGGTIAAAGAVLGGLSAILTTLGTVAAAVVSPVGLAVAAVTGLGVAIVKYTSVGAQAVEWLKDQFGQLLAPVLTTISGIKDAIAAGDIALAVEVLMAGIRASMATAIAKIRELWGPIHGFLVGLWYDAVAGITLAVSGLQEVMARVVGFIREAWAKLAAGVQSTWAKAQNAVTRSVLQAQKFIQEKLTGEEFDITVELNQADKDLEETLGKIRSEKDEAISKAKEQTDTALAKIEADRSGALAAIDEQEKERRKEINDQVAAAADAAREARAKLDELAGQAGVAADAAKGVESKSVGDRFAGLIDDVAEGVKTASKTVSAGTFSSQAVAAQLTPANSIDAKQLDELKKIAADVKQTAKNTKFGGVIPIGA